MNSHNAWGLDSEARAKLEAVGLTDPDAKVGVWVGVGVCFWGEVVGLCLGGGGGRVGGCFWG